MQYFRFPYLRYGKTAEMRSIAAQKLASIGYSVAHVSAATSEWLIAKYYEEALKKQDAMLVRDLSQAYVEHMVESLGAAHELAIQKTGRDVAQITLAHVNRLAGDHLSDVLTALRRAVGNSFRCKRLSRIRSMRCRIRTSVAAVAPGLLASSLL